LQWRDGKNDFAYLLEGDSGCIDNFSLVLGDSREGFHSPRHRHNFEQIRFELTGTLDYARDGKIEPGMVGYFPEGVYYGPQTVEGEAGSDGEVLTLVYQFGGASGGGFVSNDEAAAAADELRKRGEFKKGVYRASSADGSAPNLDGFQAVWEEIMGRPLEYPQPRYDRPFVMNPRNFAWLPVAGQPGVYTKSLGVFTECETRIEFVKIERGATFSSSGMQRGIFFVVEGAGSVHGEQLRRFTTTYSEPGELMSFSASDDVEMLYVGLPRLELLGQSSR